MDKTTLILVGHGGAPSDYPRERLQKLKRLEGERMARKIPDMSAEEAALDTEIRAWPRTPATDAYKFGLEALAGALARRTGQPVVAAYNEFCGPSIEQAVESAAAAGAKRFILVTTMYTRGGVHSECEIPMLVSELRKKRPDLDLRYAWPFRDEDIADFLAGHIEAGDLQPAA